MLELLLHEIGTLGIVIYTTNGGIGVEGSEDKLNVVRERIRLHKLEILSVLRLIDLAADSGFELRVQVIDGESFLRVRHSKNANPPASLIALLQQNKAALIEILRQRDSDMLEIAPSVLVAPTVKPAANRAHRTVDGRICSTCRKVERCFPEPEGSFICPACVEWRVQGCLAFTVLKTADEQAERRSGACIRCGAPWLMHGSPSAAHWVRVSDSDTVAMADVQYVIHRAEKIARGEVA